MSTGNSSKPREVSDDADERSKRGLAMNLFRCHAVMPRVRDEPHRVLKTYVAIAHTWQAARALVRAEAHETEFVTVPVKIDDVWMVGERLISEREFAQLQTACEWNENQLCSSDALPKKGRESHGD